MIIAALASLVGQTEPSGSGTTLPPLAHPSIEYSALLPELILIGGAIALLVVSSMMRRRPRPGLYSALTIVTGMAAGLSAVWEWHHFNLPEGARHAVVNAIAVDGFSIFVAITISSAVVIGALVADS